MWKVVSASVVGTSHTEANIPCQDDCYSEIIRGVDGQNYLVCVVADGAGSAKEGGKGAELACLVSLSGIEASLNAVTSFQPTAPIVREWVEAVRRAIHEEAQARSLTARDFACTLLAAVVGPGGAVFFQIGDGAIVASSGYSYGVVFWPESGPYANMTYFVTDEDALEHLQVAITSARVDEVALFSDGLQRLALSFEQLAPHAPFFEPMLGVLRKRNAGECDDLGEQLAQFLGSTRINERTDDDKTLVLATRREP